MPRILLATGEYKDLCRLSELLCGMGYEVDCASGVHQAFACALQFPPDALLLDELLSGFDTGLQAARAIRKIYPAVPLIFMSDRPFESLSGELENLAPFHVVPKACEPQALHATLQDALKWPELSSPSQAAAPPEVLSHPQISNPQADVLVA